MGKRSNETVEESSSQQLYPSPKTSKTLDKGKERQPAAADDAEMGEFEDPFGDEDEGDDDDEVIVEGDADEDAMMEEEEANEEDDQNNMRVYLPGDELKEGEVLVPDNSAYEMLHQLQVEWPCLSFDILQDQLGIDRKSFPMTCYVVAGSQAERAKDNKLYIMKMSDLHRTKHDNDDMDDDDSDADGLDDDPLLSYKTIQHNGGVNRVRAVRAGDSHIVSSWSEHGKVYIWDVTTAVSALDTPGLDASNIKPAYSVQRHRTEGFALDWSTVGNKYRLLSGDFHGKIFLTSMHSASNFETASLPFTGHKNSIEDLQWSPAEENVFASCSSDGTIKVWDVRTKNKAQISWKAHSTDVNVITWNRITDRLLASGSDSGEFSVWDFRSVTASLAGTSQPNATATPAASFAWHRKPITSIEWHSAESSVLAVSSEDDQITLWDLALERDAEEEPMFAQSMTNGTTGEAKMEVPPQLLFIHQGQEAIKEIHWHRQAPGVLLSTSLSGMNVFKTINS